VKADKVANKYKSGGITEMNLLKNLSFSQKLVAIMMAVSMIPLAITGVVSYQKATETVKTQVNEDMMVVRDEQCERLTDFFDTSLKDLEGRNELKDAFNALNRGFGHGGLKGDAYKEALAKYDDTLQDFKNTDGYYDVILVNPGGDIIYTASKESDLGTNLVSGPYSNSNLAECFKGATQAPTIVDFAEYAPSKNAPAMFLGAPLKDSSNRIMGAAFVQVDGKTVDDLATVEIGDTGELMLVGQDKLVRSNPRGAKDDQILKTKVDTVAVNEALGGKTGSAEYTDENGNNVLGIYEPTKIGNFTWASIVEMTTDDAYSGVIALRNIIIILTLIIAAITIAVALFFMRGVTKMTTGVTVASESVANAADQIAAGNQELAQRTQEQASALEETASTIEQMSSAIKQTAENSGKANSMVKGTVELAQNGGKIVNDTITSMGEVTAASKRIADIINVVNEIAFQTNLLALNAAVEAARAGEQGKGFAVVAGEVRSLAQRSAEAAKEIQNLINDSVEKVEKGNHLVDESGKTLKEIIEAIDEVADTIAEITSAMQEQSVGIEQVNKAVAMMDEVVQENSALVEESASASESLAHEAEKLQTLMEEFKSKKERLMQHKPHKQHSGDAGKLAHLKKKAPVKVAKKAAGAEHLEIAEEGFEDF
jgi:methyl-accepting chemotaxis protein